MGKNQDIYYTRVSKSALFDLGSYWLAFAYQQWLVQCNLLDTGAQFYTLSGFIQSINSEHFVFVSHKWVIRISFLILVC